MKDMEFSINIKEVQALPQGEYEVELSVEERNDEEYKYTVQVEKEYVIELGWQPSEAPDLVRASFEFLLERESPSLILKEFNLRVIANYFPEYEAKLVRNNFN